MSRNNRRKDKQLQPDIAVVPTDLRNRQSDQVTTLSASYQGPLPPPNILARYNDVLPDGANRIVAMAESQARHRQNLESAVVGGNVANEKRGQIFAFLLGMTAIVGGVFLIMEDKNAQGLASIIAAFTALAVAFSAGRIQQSLERAQKRRETQEATQNPRLPFEAESD